MQKDFGSNLLKHRGLSGAAVTVIGGNVVKWTRGAQSAPILRLGMVRQIECKGFLHPIRPAPVLSRRCTSEETRFKMPLYPETTFTFFDEKISDQIFLSLYNRLNKTTEFNWSNASFLSKLNDSELKEEFLSSIGECTMSFPHGYAHGDFGFSNMMVKDGRIYMIDFIEPIIMTPLVDIAALEMSLFSDLSTVKHLEVVVKLRKEYGHYIKQIDLLRKLKVLSFKNPDTEDHRRLFNGYFGSSDI